MSKVYVLVDPNDIGLVSTVFLREFFKLLGLDLESFQGLDYFFFRNSKAKNNTVDRKTAFQNLTEVILSKFVFEQVNALHIEMKRKYEALSSHLFYSKYKGILHKFRVFLYDLELKGELTKENLKLNLGKIKERMLSEEAFGKIVEKVNGMQLITRSFIPELMSLICQSKKESYCEQVFLNQRTKFEQFLLAQFNQLGRKMNEQEFKTAFYGNEMMFIPRQQVEILWELLKTKGLVKEKLFDLNQNLFVIANYLRTIFTMKEFLNLEVPKKFNCDFYDDFEMPHNIYMQFLQLSPLSSSNALKEYFTNIHLDP